MAHEATIRHPTQIPAGGVRVVIGFKVVHEFFDEAFIVCGGNGDVHVGIPCILQTRWVTHDKAFRFCYGIELSDVHEPRTCLGKTV